MIEYFTLPKYYNLEVNNETGDIKIFSNSKHAKGRELKQYINTFGYLTVKLNNKHKQIHSLIAYYYLGERPKNLCVNHKDGNKLNNNPNNLEYITISENIYHSIKYGMHICNRPELMPSYKDGRTNNIIEYKKNWYLKNRERILNKAKLLYNEFKNERTV